MEKTVAQFIEENKGVVSVIAKVCKTPATLIRQHQIYVHYSKLDSPSKMERYTQTAIDLNSNEYDVRKAVRDMQKKI